MPKLIFCVFEPFKYSWKIAPVQVLIQARTWGKATHVGLFLNECEIYSFLGSIKTKYGNKLDTGLAYKWFKGAGEIISATWPKIERQNIFKDYINDYVYLKEIEVTQTQYNKVKEYYLKKENKEGYSIKGLAWFLVGPIVDIFRRNHTEPDPNKEFCSEAATNALYYAGVKVFSFLSHSIEDLIMLARQCRKYTDFIEKITQDNITTIKSFNYKSTKQFYEDCNNGKYYYGFKISPRVFKINPIFKDIGKLKITKEYTYLV